MADDDVRDDDVRRVIDQQAVNDLLVGYVLALDRRDWETVARCFASDAVFVHPAGRVEGADGIVGRARRRSIPWMPASICWAASS